MGDAAAALQNIRRRRRVEAPEASPDVLSALNDIRAKRTALPVAEPIIVSSPSQNERGGVPLLAQPELPEQERNKRVLSGGAELRTTGDATPRNAPVALSEDIVPSREQGDRDTDSAEEPCVVTGNSACWKPCQTNDKPGHELHQVVPGLGIAFISRFS